MVAGGGGGGGWCVVRRRDVRIKIFSLLLRFSLLRMPGDMSETPA